jgi:glycosyltransferase involved in cell wall biosynthesis/GT2 family glycosyltransferase
MQRKLKQRDGEVKRLRRRATGPEAQPAASYSRFQWLLRNIRRMFKLLGWLGTGQFTRAGRALLPYYRRYVPPRVQEMIPRRVRVALFWRLSTAYQVSRNKFVAAAFQHIPLLSGEAPLSNPSVKLIAFYLPQFHQIPENDAFWGEGFTDWTNVQAAKPQFARHYQPRIPGELGYYNLLDPKVQRRQVEVAKLYGVGAFCFYFYWFNGRRPLEKPVENYLKDPELDLPFCLCWANENWTRRWDGREREVLLTQRHSAEDDLAFIAHISRYLRDPRYIRIGGKPLLIVYRPGLLPSAKETARRWREWCRNNGIGDLYLAYTQSFEQVDPGVYDFDAAIEFPTGVEPENFALPRVNRGIKLLRRGFAGYILDWSDYVRRSRNYTNPGYKLFRGICPSWDNTPRRKDTARILVNSSPVGCHEWLLNAIDDTCLRFQNHDEQLVFVNAWNEWAEGAYLEPDARYGYAYLEAIRLALVGAVYLPLSKEGATWVSAYLQGQLRPVEREPVVLLCGHYSGPYVFGGERSFLDILDGLHTLGANVICTIPSTRNYGYINAVRERSIGVYILPYRQWSPSREDEAIIEKFVEIIQRHNANIVYANTIMLREPLTAAHRCGVVTVTHAREIITYDQHLASQIGLASDEIVKQVVSKSDYIIANSQATAGCYKQSKSVMVVPNMVDIDQMHLANEIDPADIRFALVSNNLPKKGLNDLIQLARLCEPSIPKARFLIIGPDNQYVNALKKDQRNGKIPKNVEFSGYKDTPREAMAEANVVLILSHFKESFGRTAIEAMAAGRPVIAYDWGAPSELIRDGETGFLVDFQNMDQLVDRVKTLCENPGLISKMGDQGRVFVSAHYSAKRFVERLKDAYSNILYKVHSRRKVCSFNLLRKAPPTAIIIPVYNAYEELQECIASVQEYTNLVENRLIVIDDASDDVRVRQFLEGVNNIELICNEQNAGYTKTCNKGISLAAPYDVVLLNGDTIVTPRWLESLRIAAYSTAEIGTATAMSDNAGAFSMPIPNQQNKKPDGIDYPDYARLMRQFCGGCEVPNVPTGNGFCMFIKRALINQIGYFDAVAFPRGYGEENDFCMRALNAGWRNVIAPAAFVFHHRQASFGTEKEQLLAAGMKVIKKRYPDYTQRVRDAFSSLAMKRLRRAAQHAAAMATTRHVETRVAVLTQAGSPPNVECDKVNRRLFMLVDADKISLPQADAMLSNLVPVTDNFEQEFATWLLSYGIDRVEVGALNNLPFDLSEVCNVLGIPYTLECPE